jgi:rRNA maturation endonuclease Nob1
MIKYCPYCGRQIRLTAPSNYCPNCGGKLDWLEETNDEYVAKRT